MRTGRRLPSHGRHRRPRAPPLPLRRWRGARADARSGHRAEEGLCPSQRPVHPPGRPAQGRHGWRGQHRYRQPSGRRVVPPVRQPGDPRPGQLGAVDRLYRRRPGRQPADGALADLGRKRCAVRHRGQRQPHPGGGNAPAQLVECRLRRPGDLGDAHRAGQVRPLPHALGAAPRCGYLCGPQPVRARRCRPAARARPQGRPA
ncbi:hypothetical protein D3C81_1332110 [compost metagenome]